MTRWCDEGSLTFITLTYSNEVVGAPQVQLGEGTSPHAAVLTPQVVAIAGLGFEGTIVNKRPHASVLLGQGEKAGSRRGCRWSDKLLFKCLLDGLLHGLLLRD